MIKQKCVRTYEKDQSNNCTEKSCCRDLNYFLECGWKVVMVTPKEDYNEYIIEMEMKDSKVEK